jgi:NAD(P)-dependent dehydrogenase (short-subunit alcohol dehydrogenase family)
MTTVRTVRTVRTVTTVTMVTTVLITGANKGLGRETARQLASLGWSVLVGARHAGRGEEAAADLAAASGGRNVRFVPLDVTSDESVAAAAAWVGAEIGQLDVLINNAGITGGAVAPLDTAPADFLACFGVNLLGTVRVTRAFIPRLRASSLPRIVMVSSGMGSIGVTSNPERLESGIVSLVYPSSKTALNMVTTQYAKALPGWKVNAVDPGYTATDLNAHRGHKTVEEGARAIVAAATLGSDGPTGGFFDDAGPVPW